jgi:hypothetical protein
MPNIFTDQTFSEVYNDDYRDSDHYHQILFNNGRPVQQRELNQLQTILSKEVERFGRNIFKEGAAVSPVQNVKVNNKYRYVQVEQTSVPGGVDLVGLTMVGATSGVEAKVLEVVPYVDANNPLTLYVSYTDTNSSFSSATDIESVSFTLTENIENVGAGVTLTVKGTTSAMGYGTRADVGQGVFFVRGHFVQADSQNILISRYSSTPTTQLGFKVTEDIVTVDDTTDLYDNTGAVPNLSSPGADRYRIRLTLTTSDDIDSDEQFAYVAQIVNGVVTEVNNGRREYNLILDLLAERTFEESGNYAVKPFLSIFNENTTDNTKLDLKVQAGIGYVLGYRVAPGAKTISVNKPLTTITLEDEDISASYGNYILVDEPVGLFDIDSFEQVTMFDAANGLGSSLGTARVRSLEARTDGRYRLYLFDVRFNTGAKVSNVASFGVGSRYANVNPEGSTPQILESNKNNLFFSLPNPRANWEVDPSFDMVVQRVFSGTTDGSGNLSLSTGSVDTFTDTSEWLVFLQNGALQTVPLGNFGSTGNTSITITGLSSTTTYDVLTLVNTQDVAPRKKSRTSFTLNNASLDSDNSLLLQRADVISVTVIDDATSKDVTNDYLLDNGQRDNYYGIGKITLKPGRTEPATTITVTTTYFSHSTSGGYFCAASYNNNISGFTYADIPEYVTTKGETIPLREVLDFRPTQQYTGSGFEPVTNGGRINYLPRNTSTLSSDIQYYLPRRDVLAIDTEQNLLYIEGVPSFTPEYPQLPPRAMRLYNIELGANTLGVDDLRLHYIDNRRYTMRDIGRIDRQVQENRELITLNALELDTKTLEVLDDNGLPRTKAGFFVDNFTNFRPGDIADPSFLCSLDIEQGILKPHFDQKEISLVYDSDQSTNTVVRGNGVFLKYQHEVLIDQPKASGVINVNPFNVITNNGVMTLTPSKDNWFSTRRTARAVAPAQFIPGRWSGTNERILRGLDQIDPNWRQWDWSWWGRNGLLNENTDTILTSDNRPGQFGEFLAANNVPNAQQAANQFVSRHGQLGIVKGESGITRTTRQTDIPFMRSREVAVKVEGLMPATRHYPFFDEVDVLKWCKQLTEGEYNTLVAANRSDDPPVYETNGLSERPDGYTTTGITSNEEGTAYFSFIVPETGDLLFPTGTLELAVYDITSPVANNANSQAAAEYTAEGIEEELTETSGTVRLTTYDPIAQSFRNGLNHGVYLTKVDIYVATKDDTRPLIVEIRPLVNGSPSAIERLRYGISTKSPADITTSLDASAVTTFEFERPVYLEANTSYALVVRSESNQYFVYQATMGQFELQSSEKRITAQPYMGSLFASQNGETWEPQQDKDLKFTAYVADFTPSGLSGTAFMENAKTPAYSLPNNPFITNGTTELRVTHPYHGMNEGDTVILSRWSTADSDDAAPTGFTPGQIETGAAGTTIFNVDTIGYSVTLDSAASVSEEAGGAFWQASQNHRYHLGRNAVNTFEPNGTFVVSYNRFTSAPSIMSSGTGNTKDVSRTLTTLQRDVIFDTPRVIASNINEVNNLAGNKSLDLEVEYSTSNKYLSPVINIDDASFMTIQTAIDFQADSDGIANTVNPYEYIEETDPRGGTALSKYVSKDIPFANAATGLKILVGANVPTTASFDVYYKIANESQTLIDQPWVLIAPEVVNPNDNDPSVYREYRYLAGGLTGTLEEFNKVKVKIVMKSTSEAKYPAFKDLRVIAMED